MLPMYRLGNVNDNGPKQLNPEEATRPPTAPFSRGGNERRTRVIARDDPTNNPLNEDQQSQVTGFLSHPCIFHTTIKPPPPQLVMRSAAVFRQLVGIPRRVTIPDQTEKGGGKNINFVVISPSPP